MSPPPGPSGQTVTPFSEPPDLPPRTGDHRVFALFLLAIICVVGVAVAALWFLRPSEESPRAVLHAPPSPGAVQSSPVPAAPTPGEPPTEEERESDPAALTQATVAGWQGVAVHKRGIAYDVPPDWVVHPPDVISGFEEEDPDAPFGFSPTVGMSGVAESGERVCESGYPPSPAAAGTSSAGEPVDTSHMAAYLASEWASAAYANDNGDPQFPVGSPQPFAANGLTGHQITVDVTVPQHPCYPDTAQVRVLSFVSPGQDDTYNLIIYADTSGEDAPASSDLDTIASSLRPLSPP